MIERGFGFCNLAVGVQDWSLEFGLVVVNIQAQDCFSPASCFVTTYHVAVHQNPADAVLADTAHFGARLESAYGLVELPGRLASRRRWHRVDLGGNLPGRDLPLRRGDVSER